MISLAQSEAPEYGDMSSMSASPYPYGMRLHLNDDVLEKVGNLPAVGSRVAVTAYALVVRAEAEPVADGEESERSACLQITEIEIAPAPGADAASILFDGQ